MLYLLGGASRAGKSKLARRLLNEHRIPHFSLDILMMGLANGLPEFGLDPDDSGIKRGEQLWPILRAMCVNVLETNATYLFEADLLLPKHVAELMSEYGKQVRGCFIGYADVPPEAKLRAIRQFGGESNDWVQDSTDEYVLTLINEMIEFSRYLRLECAIRRLQYVDGSADFDGALNAAFNCLVTD